MTVPRCRSGSVRESRATLLEGPPGASIVSQAASIGCDLIILGHRGLSGLERFFLGSVSEYVIRHAHCPVLVVKKAGGHNPPSLV